MGELSGYAPDLYLSIDRIQYRLLHTSQCVIDTNKWRDRLRQLAKAGSESAKDTLHKLGWR